MLFIRDKKRYKDIYINTHQTLWRTLLLLLLLLLLLNATTSIYVFEVVLKLSGSCLLYILPAPTSRVSSSLKQEEKQDKSLGFLLENSLRHFRPRIYFKNIQTNKNKMQSMIAQRASALAHCKVITRQVRLLRVLSSLWWVTPRFTRCSLLFSSKEALNFGWIISSLLAE